MYPGGEPFRRHYNRSGYFNKFNRNKLDIALDLTHSEGRELFLRLVEQSTSFWRTTARVMRNFDLEYPVLKKANRASSWCPSPALARPGRTATT